jgi:hypothetical protein
MNTEQAYIEGFVKRASEYGLDESQAIEIYKSARALGPIEATNAAEMIGNEALLKSMAYNKENHPKHYYFNPLVPGPISRFIINSHRRSTAGHADKGFTSNAGALIKGDKNLQNKIRKLYDEQVGGYDV